MTFKERREAELRALNIEHNLGAANDSGDVDITRIPSWVEREAANRALGSMLDEILAVVKPSISQQTYEQVFGGGRRGL